MRKKVTTVQTAPLKPPGPRYCRLCGNPTMEHIRTMQVDRYQLIRVLHGQEPCPEDWLRDCRSVAEETDDFPF